MPRAGRRLEIRTCIEIIVIMMRTRHSRSRDPCGSAVLMSAHAQVHNAGITAAHVWLGEHRTCVKITYVYSDLYPCGINIYLALNRYLEIHGARSIALDL